VLGVKLTSKQVKLFVLISVVAVVGAVGGGYYNATEPARAAQDSAVVRSGADASVVVPAAGSGAETRTVTMPFRNDSPDPITLTSLILPFADQLTWTPTPVTLQPGQTGYALIVVPTSCLADYPAAGSGPLRTAPVKHSATEQQVTAVYLKVNTIDGNTHGITLGADGALAAAAYNCGKVTLEGE
jgi:hypothetical protein